MTTNKKCPRNKQGKFIHAIHNQYFFLPLCKQTTLSLLSFHILSDNGTMKLILTNSNNNSSSTRSKHWDSLYIQGKQLHPTSIIPLPSSLLLWPNTPVLWTSVTLRCFIKKALWCQQAKTGIPSSAISVFGAHDWFTENLYYGSVNNLLHSSNPTQRKTHLLLIAAITL